MIKTDTPKVSIVILNWNGKKDTIECLNSLKKITYPNYEIILVDNGSTDGSVKCFKKLYPEIEIIVNKENLGFAEGNNVGIRKAFENQAEFVLALNNDTVVDPTFLSELVNVARADPKIGIVGPAIYSYTEPETLQQYGGEMKLNQALSIHNTKISLNTDFDFISGCSMLINSNIFKSVGLFDTTFFAYYEDNDFCVRVKNKGYRLVMSPKAKIWHKGSASTGGYMSKKFLYFMIRNRIIFARKHLKTREVIFFNYYLFLEIVFRLKYLFKNKKLNYDHFLIVLNAVFNGYTTKLVGVMQLN